MTFDRSQLRNLSPEAEKFLKDFDARKQVQAESKPIEHVAPIYKRRCADCGRVCDFPKRPPAVGCCPYCGSLAVKPYTPSAIVNAPLSPQEQAGKDLVERVKQQTENPQEPAPLVADAEWFDREERAAMQAEGRS